MHQHGGFAFGLQAVQHALHAQQLARQHGFRQLEHVVARHVQHGRFNLRPRQFASGVQQRQLLNLLVGSEQIAFDAVGKKGQRALAFLAADDALALGAQALGNPLRQCSALDRLDGHADAVAVQCGKPRAGFGRFIEARQQHQRQRAVVASGGLRQLLQRRTALFARLARGHADFQNLLVGKQALRTASGAHRAPVKVRAGHGEAAALGVALRARGGADGVGRFLLQQRLVAMQGVERAQAFVQVRRQLVQGELHGLNNGQNRL